MDMSNGHSAVESYADLEIETFEVRAAQFAGDADGSGVTDYVSTEIDALSESGGLDHNEVAEVVGFELHTALQAEYADVDVSTGNVDQAAELRAGSTQMRGAFGVNLSISELLNGPGDETSAATAEKDGSGGSPGAFAGVYVQEEPGVLSLFSHDYIDATLDNPDDGSAPYATGASHGTKSQVDKFYPELGIRGPVIDENDSLSWVIGLVNENSVVTIEGTVFVRIMYRIHEIEGVRNDFDLP